MNAVNVCIAVRKICGMLNVHCESPMDQRDSHTIHSMRDKTSLSSVLGRKNVEAADRFISLLEGFKKNSPDVGLDKFPCSKNHCLA